MCVWRETCTDAACVCVEGEPCIDGDRESLVMTVPVCVWRETCTDGACVCVCVWRESLVLMVTGRAWY